MRNSLKQTSPTYSNSSVLCSILSAEWIWMNSFNMRRILLRALRAVDYSMIGMSQQKYSSAHGNNAFSARSSSFVPALPCQCGIVRNSRHLRVLEDVISLQNALLIAPWLLTHGKTKPWYQLRALPWQWWFAWLLRFGQSKRVIIKACFKRWSIGMNRCTFRGRDVLDCQKCQLNNIPCPATQKWSFLSVSQPSQHCFSYCFVSSVYKFALGISQHPSQCPVEFLTPKPAVKVVHYAPRPHCSAMLDAFATGGGWTPNCWFPNNAKCGFRAWPQTTTQT